MTKNDVEYFCHRWIRVSPRSHYRRVAGPTGTYVSGVRELNLPLASGNFTLDAGSTITMRMFYRSVEDGTHGDVVPMPASASDGEGGTIPGAWSNDCRCTLYIDLQ